MLLTAMDEHEHQVSLDLFLTSYLIVYFIAMKEFLIQFYCHNTTKYTKSERLEAPQWFNGNLTLVWPS